MNDAKIYPAIVASIVKDVPTYKVIAKEDSPLMQAIAVPMKVVNPRFNEFITTITATTYAPKAAIAEHRWGVIGHEGVHARDDAKWGPLFKISYLPLLLSPLAGLASLTFVSHWFLLFLIFLVTLAPLPAPARVYWERRGYLMTACLDAITGTHILATDYIEAMVDHYCTGQYYWMCWSRNKARAFVTADMKKALELVAGTLVLEPYTSTIAVARAADKS